MVLAGTQCGTCRYSVWYLRILSMVLCGYSIYLLVLSVVLLGSQYGTCGYSVRYLWVLSVVLMGTQYDTRGYSV
jgi:hypothetical protein